VLLVILTVLIAQIFAITVDVFAILYVAITEDGFSFYGKFYNQILHYLFKTFGEVNEISSLSKEIDQMGTIKEDLNDFYTLIDDQTELEKTNCLVENSSNKPEDLTSVITIVILMIGICGGIAVYSICKG